MFYFLRGLTRKLLSGYVGGVSYPYSFALKPVITDDYSKARFLVKSFFVLRNFLQSYHLA